MNLKKLSRRAFIHYSGVGLLTIPLTTRHLYGIIDSRHPISDQPASRQVITGLFPISENSITINKGSYSVASGQVSIKRKRTFDIKPTETVAVKNEYIELNGYRAESWNIGTRLQGPRAGFINAMHALIEDSLVMAASQGAPPLIKGKDYIVSAPFALVALAPGSDIEPGTGLYASYSYYLQRIDSIAVSDKGTPMLIEGKSVIVSPEIPEIPSGTKRLCNIYRPFRGTHLTEEHIFPCLKNAEDVVTETTPGSIPRVLEKLKSGKPITIVCWGDSITVGADVKPESAWANSFETHLRKMFPESRTSFHNHSIGGSKSAQWLHNGKFPGLPELPSDTCSFDKIMNLKPDLIVMEFLNDAVLTPEVLKDNYRLLHSRLGQINCELIVVTPSKRLFNSFDLGEMKKKDDRYYVSFVKDFARKNGYAIADTTSRWDHLHLEGIPYFSLFNNGFNHPNEFGHQLFVEEIMKCFS